MAAEEEKGEDFYDVLGLDKECSDLELKNAYKKLAMRWHPDKCTASGNANKMEESKEKFQEIQKAYSVLSDSNKRFLYDVGVYDNNDDEDQNGMGDFLGELAQMINESKPSENRQESFEELQRMFVELFQDDINDGSGSGSSSGGTTTEFYSSRTTDGRKQQQCGSSATAFANGSNKRGNSVMANSGNAKSNEFDLLSTTATDNFFCYGLNDGGESSSKGRGGSSSKRRGGRKQRTSCKHDVSSNDTILS